MTRRKPAAAAATAPLYRLLSDDVAGVPNASVWQRTDTGGLVVLAEGLDPNVTPEATQTARERDDSSDETAADRVAEMLMRGREGAEARVKVNEVQPDGTLAYCGEYTPEDFERGNTLELIRKQWGAGKYHIAIYARNPNNKNRFTRNHWIVVTIKPRSDPDPAEVAGGQVAQVLERIERALAGNSAQAKPQMESLKETLGLMTMMREAMGLSAQPVKQPSMVEQITQLVAALKGAQDIAKEVNPQPEPEGVLERLAPKMLDIVQSSMNQPKLSPVALPPSIAAAPNDRSAPAAATAPGAVHAAATNGAPAMDDEETKGMKVAITTLNNLALFQMDPDLAADMIFDRVPDDAVPLLERPDWFEQLTRIDPSCNRHKDWYVRTHAALLKLFEEEKNLPAEGEGARAAGGAR